MKKIIYICTLVAAFGIFWSCDFLDVIPEGKATEADLWKTSIQAKKFVYRCYNAIPDKFFIQAGPDLCAGDDFISGWYGFIDYFHWKSLIYNKNRESSSNSYFRLWDSQSSTFTGIQNSWNFDIYGYIRNCWYALNNLPTVKGITDQEVKNLSGECYFLIAYYHHLLLEYYGPVILIKEEQSLNASYDEIYVPRSSYDDCVAFIAENYKKAIDMLPVKWESTETGRVTAAAAHGFLARLYLFAASPQVNGNAEFYSNFKNKDGEPLMNLVYDKEKWKLAMDAAENAIEYCEENGFGLFYNDDSPVGTPQTFDEGIANYHNCFTGYNNNVSSWYNEKEYLFSMYLSSAVGYMIQAIAPRVGYTTYNANGFRGYVVPTWEAVNMYLSKNGLPMDEDPETRDLDLYSIAPGDNTALIHRNREPRFYASVGYDGGEYEVNGTTITINSLRGGQHGIPSSGNLGYDGWLSKNGYFCKKWVSKMDSYNSSTNKVSTHSYSYPYLRMAELYLSYAEAVFEYTGQLDALGLTCLNKVRYRAGLPSFQESWAKAGGIPSGEKLRQEIRRERSIEFLMEGRRFFDIRRWKIAEESILKKQKSWNLLGDTKETFYQVTDMYEHPDYDGVRVFESPRDYWLAIPLTEMNTNQQLVQNPGY